MVTLIKDINGNNWHGNIKLSEHLQKEVAQAMCILRPAMIVFSEFTKAEVFRFD